MNELQPNSDPITAVLPDLADTRVLVIGAGSVGQAVVRMARDLGLEVAVANRSQAKLDTLADSMPEIQTRLVNAREQASIDQLLNDIRPDHIILSTGRVMGVAAGQINIADVIDYVGDRIEPMLAVSNWIARSAVKPRSFIVVAGFIGVPTMGNLAWSIAGPAIKGLMEHLAVELGPTRVNVVAPGPLVDTPMAQAATGDEAAVGRMIAALEAQLPIGKAVMASDAARQVVHLAGDPVATGSMRFAEGGLALAPGSLLRDLHLDRDNH